MIRPFPLVVCTMLFALSLAPHGSAGAEPADAEDRFTAALERFREAHETQRVDKQRDAVAYLRDHLTARSLVPAEKAEQAWHENLSRTEDDGTAVYAAEAILFAIVYANVQQALALNDPEALDLWVGLAYSRTTRDGWSIPEWTDGRAVDPHAQNVTKDLHAIIASRAREVFVTALLLERGGERAEARATADGAALLLSVIREDAAARLPPDMARVFRDNATLGRALFGQLPEERKADTWPGLFAPLVALELDRTVEPLDSFAMRNVDAVLAVARAAHESPDLQAVLAAQAWEQYGADRAGLYLRGEGAVDEVDRAYRTFHNVSEEGGPELVSEAAQAVRDALTTLGLLERGIVLKVESGGVRHDRVHEYGITIVRPPLEGVAEYQITITFDENVVRISGIVPPRRTRSLDAAPTSVDGWVVRVSGGEVALDVVPDSPLRRSALVAKLQINAEGAPGSETPLAIRLARFVEPDGDEAKVFKLRDGHATVAVVAGQEQVGESPSLFVPALVMLLLLVARAVGGRRSGPP